MNSDEVRYRPADDVTVAEMEGEIVAYAPSSAKGYHLNETATWIWKHIGDCGGPADLAVKMSEEFDCELPRLQADVEKALDDMAAAGLLVRAGDSEPRG
jgi:hypothetical protein